MVWGCDVDPVDVVEPVLCNGQTFLCDRPVNEVAFLRSHNSHASEERGYTVLSMNQFFAIPTQLEDGVRSLNVDVYEWKGELTACHGYCELGNQPFVDILDEVETFLSTNPREVVLLDFQDEAPAGAIVSAIANHAIVDLTHTQAIGEAWPTLGEMIGDNKRLVIMGESQDSDPLWMHDTNEIVYSPGWSYQTPKDFDCAIQTIPFGLYEISHVITNPLPSPSNAKLVNYDPVLSDHIYRCVDEVGFVNLISLDFYSIGDGFKLVDDLNAMGLDDQ